MTLPVPARLQRRLGLPEALGLSVAIISPSIGMAFNVVLVVQVAGAAAPLAFMLGTGVMAVVALSFVAFSRRQSHAGAAYAFIAHAFGAPFGVLAGWAMLLVYTCFCTGLAILVGRFITAALADIGVAAQAWGVPLAAIAIAICAALAWRDVRLASRLMLALEAISVTAILILALVILVVVQRTGAWSVVPFSVPAGPGGWIAMGFSMVFAVLSFAGFEAAATLGEEAVDPRRTIPRAMLGSVIGTGIFYVVVSYAVVLGFGLGHMPDLAHAAAPLDDLSRRMVGNQFAVVLDLGCAVSSFSGVLGSLTGAVRVMFALGRGGLSPALARIDRVHHTPALAVVVCALASALPLLVVAGGVDIDTFYGDTATMGTLAVILVYIGVTIGEAVEAAGARRLGWVMLGVLGTAILGWVLLCSVLPSTGPSGVLWAVAVVAWLVLGGGFLVLRPALRRWHPPETA